MLADIASIEKRMERLEKDLKKIKNAAFEREFAYLERAKAWLESEKPLREMEVSDDERKLVKGFAFLSEKPMIYVENIAEDQLGRLRHPDANRTLQPNTEQTIICGKLEAEMAELSPEELKTFLDDYGLDSALRQYLDVIRQHSEIRFEYEHAGNPDHRLPPGIEAMFYRIAQEAITNVLRHSRAKHASIVVMRRDEEAILLIEDDGIGFSTTSGTEGRLSGIGLRGMKERASLAGGRINVESNSGTGTSIRISVPLEVIHG